MMGLQREHPSLLPRNMNMNSNWNQAAGTGTGDGEHEDGRISSRRESHQGGSPSDPLLSAGRFYPVPDNNEAEADDDSPIDSYTGGSALQASPFLQQHPFAASGGLQAPTISYNPIHGTPTALNLPAQERKRPPPNHPGHPLLRTGQPKEADEQEQQNEPAAAGLDRKQPYIINDPDPFLSPHPLATSFEDEGTPAASAKRARTNTAEYYPPSSTPHHPPAAVHLQHPATGPYYSATWQQDDHFHHHHHYAHPFEHYPPAPPIAVYNFGNDQQAHGLGMHPPPPPPPAMPHPPSVPPSPLHSQHVQRARNSLTPPSILPRRSSRPSSRVAAVAANRDPVVNLPRSVRAARAGEATVQAMHPTEEELAECQTPRARQALETWYQRLTELHMFKNQEGHCCVPQQYPENRPLGVWVNKQRMEKKNHEKNMRTSLTETKIANLNRLGFEWGKRKGDEAWQARYQELVEYRQTHGNCDVPTKYIANPALGRWVSTQRSQFKTYPNKHMTQDRVNDLNDIGFRWSMMEQDVPSPQQQQPNETATHE